MSIEYFVEGEVKYDLKGDFKTFSKENIVTNSALKIYQKGLETGVSYNEPQTIDENDTPEETIDVSLNLFFDGTKNNKTNTESRIENNETYNKQSNKDDDSYMNDYTNIARGYNAVDPSAENQAVVYIEGIGSVDEARDSLKLLSSMPNNLGFPLGEGPRGVKAKVVKGCNTGAKITKNKFEDKKINILKVNVYGFSRGATAARHFVHVATTGVKAKKENTSWTISPPEFYELSDEEKKVSGQEDQIVYLENISEEQENFINTYGYFGACLIKEEMRINKVIFNFVGLYDTVASFGINHRGTSIFGISIVDDDSKQLKLDAVKKANFTFQIASDDEFRDNFSLTNINSTGLNGLEFTLPGVHSDIGGSYIEGEEEIRKLHGGTEDECKIFQEILEEEGWYDKSQLKIDLKMNGTGDYVWYELIGTRILSNQYDKIPLHQMFHYSKQFDVIYNTSTIEKKEKINNDEIKEVYSYLALYMNKCHNIRSEYVKEYIDGKSISIDQYLKDIKQISYLNDIPIELLKKLRNKYLHWSVSNKIGMGPNVAQNTTFDKRKRYILQG